MRSTMMEVPLSLNHLLDRAGALFATNEIVSRLPDKSLRITLRQYYRGRGSSRRAAGVSLQGAANPRTRAPGRAGNGSSVCSRRARAGRACPLRRDAFRDLSARFWLDVKARTARWRSRSRGFVEEGRLRESVRSGPASTR